MPDLQIEVLGIEPQLFAAAPMLAFKLRVSEVPSAAGATHFRSIALQCQIRIEPVERRYSATEQTGLFELFGHPSQWGQSLRSMLWTHAQVAVGPFTGNTTATLPVPCSYDFNIAATKYFHALEAGDVPLSLLFSGTMFYAEASGALQVAQISWQTETTCRLPADAWQQMMDHYYPNSVWLRVPRDLFDRLNQYKLRQGLRSWDQAIERLLPADSPQAVP